MSMKHDAGVLVHTLQQQLRQKDVEIMNLKMENAHIRERLSARVGGDTNALELEAETYSLKTQVNELETELMNEKEENKLLDQKYEKAMSNLVKLDTAWKTAREQSEYYQNLSETFKCDLEKCLTQFETYKKDTDNEKQKLRTSIQENLDQLYQAQTKCNDITKTLEFKTNEYDRLLIKLHEAEARMEEANHLSNDNESKQQEKHASISKELENAKEEVAMTRGQIKAFEDELSRLHEQYERVHTISEERQARILHLVEENSNLTIHLNSMKQNVTHHEKDESFLKSEIDRLQNEILTYEKKFLEFQHEKQEWNEKEKNWKDQGTREKLQYENEKKEYEWKQKQIWTEKKEKLNQEFQKQTTELMEIKESCQIHKEIMELLEKFYQSSFKDKKKMIQMETFDKFDQILVIQLIRKDLEKIDRLIQEKEQNQQRLQTFDKMKLQYQNMKNEKEHMEKEYEKNKAAMQRMVQRQQKRLQNNIFSKSKSENSLIINEKENQRNGCTIYSDLEPIQEKGSPRKRQKLNTLGSSSPTSQQLQPKRKSVVVKSRYLQSHYR